MVTPFIGPFVLLSTLKPSGLRPGSGMTPEYSIEKQEGNRDPDDAEMHTQDKLTVCWIPVHVSLGVWGRQAGMTLSLSPVGEDGKQGCHNSCLFSHLF
jgi:hypothetical protein